MSLYVLRYIVMCDTCTKMAPPCQALFWVPRGLKPSCCVKIKGSHLKLPPVEGNLFPSIFDMLIDSYIEYRIVTLGRGSRDEFRIAPCHAVLLRARDGF
jgi:hypothetical protein